MENKTPKIFYLLTVIVLLMVLAMILSGRSDW